MKQKIQKVSELIKNANYVLITSGAGMSTDSKLPAFRSNDKNNIMDAFWNNKSFMECANPSYMEQDPYGFWGFYGYRYQLYQKQVPHQGYYQLREILEDKLQKEYFIVTSNVDGYFSRAGFPDSKIYEIHGTIHSLQCNSCGSISPSQQNPSLQSMEIVKQGNIYKADRYPICEKCQNRNKKIVDKSSCSILRPNILMFNDYDYNDEQNVLQQMEFSQFIGQILMGHRLLIIEMGAGEAVRSIRNIGEYYLSKSNNYSMVRINLQETQCYSQIINIDMKVVDFVQSLNQLL